MARSMRDAIMSAWHRDAQKQDQPQQPVVKQTEENTMQGQPAMKSTVVTITPLVAKGWLTKNTHNRSLSKTTVEKYAKYMREGMWKLNGEPIIFANDGSLMSGQHRLEACVKANTNFQSVVVTGVDRESFATLDTHRRRTASDVLGMEGAKNATRAAAAARAYVRIKYNEFTARTYTHAQYAEFVAAHPSILHWTGISRKLAFSFPSYTYGVIAAIDDLFGRDIAQDFYDRFIEGININRTDPEYLLRMRFQGSGAGTRIAPEMGLALTIKAANLRLAGKTVKQLKMVADEQFPTLLGM